LGNLFIIEEGLSGILHLKILGKVLNSLAVVLLMRIAIPANGNSLDAYVYEHFGRAPYYIIIDVDNNEIKNVEVIQNPAIHEHAPGQIPSLLASKGVNILIARGVGPRAQMFFQQLGIQVITGAFGRIREVIDAFLRGELKSMPYEPMTKWPGRHHNHHETNQL